MIQLNYRDAKPIYLQVADGYRKLIASHFLQVNEKLPSVKELAIKMAINPKAIEMAYRELEGDQLIYRDLNGEFFVSNGEALEQLEALRKEELWKKLDDAVAMLNCCDISREEIIAHLKRI